jgi:hypothetical protein
LGVVEQPRSRTRLDWRSSVAWVDHAGARHHCAVPDVLRDHAEGGEHVAGGMRNGVALVALARRDRRRRLLDRGERNSHCRLTFRPANLAALAGRRRDRRRR